MNLASTARSEGLSSSANSRRVSKPSFQRPLSRRKKPAPSPASKDNLLQKFFLRETFGQIRSRRRPVRHEVSTRFFTTSLPARLAFCLKDVVPMSAIEAGHIFMGFTKCGQFLLSYTQTSTDIELADSSFWIKYNYRLHWWLFVPSRRAKKVAEMMLFSNQGAYGNLHMSFCQWPNDMSKIVVYGHVVSENDGNSQDASSKPCYLTVTAVPSLNACEDCSKVAASYEEEDVAEGWNTCVRLSCLEHGMTLHTTFDLVPPYPLFEPRVNLKRDGYVIINTGNLLHSLKIQLESLGPDTAACDGEQTSILPDARKEKWSGLHIGTSEHTLPGGEIFSPPIVSPASMAHYSATSDSETTDCESECGFGRQKRRGHILNEERLEKVAQFVEQLHPSSPRKALALSRRRLLSFGPTTTSQAIFGTEDASSSSRRKRMAEKAYELTDDDFHDGVKEKLSTFRKKRLAEKTYEFKDEDSENVTPLPPLRSQLHERFDPQPEVEERVEDAVACVKSPRPLDSEDNVLRPIRENKPVTNEKFTLNNEELQCTSDSDSVPMPEMLSPSGHSKREGPSSIFSPRSSGYHQFQPPRFHAKFTRRFIEMDDELISVITDVEEDELGYHTRLLGITLPFH